MYVCSNILQARYLIPSLGNPFPNPLYWSILSEKDIATKAIYLQQNEAKGWCVYLMLRNTYTHTHTIHDSRYMRIAFITPWTNSGIPFMYITTRMLAVKRALAISVIPRIAHPNRVMPIEVSYMIVFF